MREWLKRVLFLLLLWPCLGAVPLPLADRNQVLPLLGQSYGQLRETWFLSAWPPDMPKFSLLPAGVVSSREVTAFGQPFLARFYFDSPSDEGSLLRLRLVHWEKGGDARALRNEKQITEEILRYYGEQAPKISQSDEARLSVYSWPGVEFENHCDQGGQTWYLTFSAEGARSSLPKIPLGWSRRQIAQSHALEKYFEPEISALAGWETTRLDLPCSPIAARTLFLFADYSLEAPLVGMLWLLPVQGESWEQCGLPQLLYALSLNFGQPRRGSKDSYLWQDKNGRLILKQQSEEQWLLQYLSVKAPGYGKNMAAFAAAPPAPQPPAKQDILGYEKFLWRISLKQAREIHPQMSPTWNRANQRGLFTCANTSFAGFLHKMRLNFGNSGLEEVIMDYDSLLPASKGAVAAVLQKLQQDFGPIDWQTQSDNEESFYWSRASGYLRLIKFREPFASWRIIFSAKTNADFKN